MDIFIEVTNKRFINNIGFSEQAEKVKKFHLVPFKIGDREWVGLRRSQFLTVNSVCDLRRKCRQLLTKNV